MQDDISGQGQNPGVSTAEMKSEIENADDREVYS
jgi:hypothetical protein